VSDVPPQTCYRHPDRRGGVICQRCDRPICPDCMHQASVGFHCPECARAGRQKVVRGPNALAAGSTLATNALIALNLAIFVYGIGDGLETKNEVIRDGGLAGPFVADGEWYRIITSGFLHANAIHIGFNMFVLYQLGQLMEPVLGRLRYVLVYFVAMLTGSLGVLLIEPNTFTVGASGAVFGMMGAAVAAMRSRGINPFQTSLGGTIMLNLLITFSLPGISIGGHVGGLIGGFVAGWILTDLGPKQWQDARIPVALTVALGLVIAGASLAVA
jgi:membrane associated rhomboid family serine protease